MSSASDLTIDAIPEACEGEETVRAGAVGSIFLGSLSHCQHSLITIRGSGHR